MKYILASGSPRRIEMMKRHGYNPIICPAYIDENIPPKHGMNETVMFLALKKAQWVREKLLYEISVINEADSVDDNYKITSLKTEGDKSIIIAADTIVYALNDKEYDGIESNDAGEIMGKPADFEDGFRMLSKIRNTCHYVATGAALLDLETGKGKVFTEVTKVWLKDYSDEELTEYLNTDEAYDKAGGYAIQGYFSKYIDHIEGDYNNVVGFPWDRIMKELDNMQNTIKPQAI